MPDNISTSGKSLGQSFHDDRQRRPVFWKLDFECNSYMDHVTYSNLLTGYVAYHATFSKRIRSLPRYKLACQTGVTVTNAPITY